MVALHHAKSGSVVAMDPRTGDILAMANYPTFDPNRAAQTRQPGRRENLAFAAPFEPGSVYKVITLAAALETTSYVPDDDQLRQRKHQPVRPRDSRHSSYAALSMADVLARPATSEPSTSDCRWATRICTTTFAALVSARRTGMPLPGESAGWCGLCALAEKLHRLGGDGPRNWRHRLQLAQACAVIASGGLLVKPRLILDAPKSEPVRVLKPETAITMRGMMEGVVIKPYGTGHKYARLLGYTSAGKTGTAQIYDTHLINTRTSTTRRSWDSRR
jgi:cell division protein FtsI (penicillin-binding protein 3)